jgi:hypothetical protein
VPCWTSDSKKIVFFSNSQVIPAISNAISVAPSGALDPEAFISSTAGGTAAPLFDETLATTWDAQGFPQSFEIDLGAVYSLVYVNVIPVQQRAYQFMVEAKAMPGDSYTTVLDARPNTVRDALIQKPFMTNASGRLIRVSITGASGYTGGSVSLNEFQIFGGLNIPFARVSYTGFHRKGSTDISIATVLAHPGLFSAVSIYTGMGRYIAGKNPAALSHELQNLAQGMYFLGVRTRNNAEHVLRFMKQ